MDLVAPRQKLIWVGKPAAADLIFGHNLGVMEGGQYEACVIAPGATSYDWSVAGANIVSGQGSECIIFEVYSLSGQSSQAYV